MAQGRSGARRRAAQKAAQLQRQLREVGSDKSVSSINSAEASSAGQLARGGKLPALLPNALDVIAAVASLYCDQLKPFGRLLRKRIAERHIIENDNDAPVSVEVDMRHLRAVCDECDQLLVADEEGGDWSVTLAGCPSKFIDVYSTDDVYPEELWAAIARYLERAPEEETTLPGGRYSCAQALVSRALQFLDGYTLGQACHIVQLAISKRKLLGYSNGAVVPYFRSQSMMREKLADQQLPCTNSCPEAASLPFATWKAARESLRTILVGAAAAKDGSGPGVVQLSTVKHMFRVNFELELSETMLGYSKLSDLLQDGRFRDVCSVRLDGNGYTVVQNMETSEAEAVGFCDDEPLCLEDAGETLDLPNFGPTPGPFGPSPGVVSGALASGQHQPEEDASCLLQLLPLYLGDLHGADDSSVRAKSFCSDEPLHFGGSNLCLGGFGIGHTYGCGSCAGLPAAMQLQAAPWPPVMPPPLPLLPPTERPSPRQRSTDEVVRAGAMPSSWPALSPWKDVQLEGMVQNTFIHAALPPPTPVLGSARRSRSLDDASRSTMASARSSCSEKSRSSEDELAIDPQLSTGDPSLGTRWPSFAPWESEAHPGMVRSAFAPPPTPVTPTPPPPARALHRSASVPEDAAAERRPVCWLASDATVVDPLC
eukprot:TRINITY_DN66887_c0_g1_i1.p1 TRINITY_DN66887_c0_g1~~TRINITY_DN66887_c0_g1_i1.p1  ORF type:complete len:654 (-),score=113.11 TRINITY_DN66887_c0_g1_i1:95-2056(-)